MYSLLSYILGKTEENPEEIFQNSKVKEFIEKCWEGIDPSTMIDIHTHIAGVQKDVTGCYVNETMDYPFWYPLKYIKKLVLMISSGVNPSSETLDADYVDRFYKLIDKMHDNNFGQSHNNPKACIFAFDQFYEKDGIPVPEKTGMYVPNEYVFKIAQEFPNHFIPVMSINPYRKDAIQELEKYAALGGRIMKWLPNSMGIELDDQHIEEFYEKMIELNVTLITHTGDEHSVDGGFLDNRLGNPLKLEYPLNLGVRIIAAHCATEGCYDHDGKIEAFRLFMNLMENPKYENLLYADISAITAFKRIGYLPELLERGDLHHRFIYGSDYPIPAINPIIQLQPIVDMGLITDEERDILKIIFKFNPLLFDFCLKRCLQLEDGDNVYKFSDRIFSTPSFLE